MRKACHVRGSDLLLDQTRGQLKIEPVFALTGCHGFCEQEPIIVFEPGNLFYCRVTAEDAKEIVAKTVVKGEIIERLLYEDTLSHQKFQKEEEIFF